MKTILFITLSFGGISADETRTVVYPTEQACDSALASMHIQSGDHRWHHHGGATVIAYCAPADGVEEGTTTMGLMDKLRRDRGIAYDN